MWCDVVWCGVHSLLNYEPMMTNSTFNYYFRVSAPKSKDTVEPSDPCSGYVLVLINTT
jgi:hypothetical protein